MTAMSGTGILLQGRRGGAGRLPPVGAAYSPLPGTPSPLGQCPLTGPLPGPRIESGVVKVVVEAVVEVRVAGQLGLLFGG